MAAKKKPATKPAAPVPSASVPPGHYQDASALTAAVTQVIDESFERVKTEGPEWSPDDPAQFADPPPPYYAVPSAGALPFAGDRLDSAVAGLGSGPSPSTDSDSGAFVAALACWNLTPAQVIGRRDIEGGVVIVTAGGRKLQWPRDKDVRLSEMEKGGAR